VRRVRPAIVLAAVGFGIFIAADDLTVATTMLRAMIRDLNIPLPEGFDRAAWIVNAYLVAYVAVMPVAGRLSDVWGRRRTFIAGLALFGAGSAIIPFTTSLGPFLAGRVLTAIGGGAVVPVALAAVGDVYAAGRRGRPLGTLGAVETLGWVWGPLFGALLVRYLGWRWQFYLNIPLAIAGIVFAWPVLKGVGTRQPHRPLDLPGAVAVSAALVALTVGLLRLGRISTAADLAGLGSGSGFPVWPMFVVAIGAAVAFVLVERRSSDPLVDPAMIRLPNVRPALGANALVGAALAVAMVNTPLFVNLVIDSDLKRAALISGGILTSLTGTMAAAAALGGFATDRLGYRAPATIGLAAAAGAFVAMGVGWGTEITAPVMALHLGVLGVGLGLVTAPLTAAVVDATPAIRRGVGAAMVVIARLVGLALGLAGLTAWALYRYGSLRRGIPLPPVTDPGYADAADAAQRSLSATVLSETFLVSAVVVAIALLVVVPLRRGTQSGDSAGEEEPEGQPQSAEYT
jgi:MFS family permease